MGPLLLSLYLHRYQKNMRKLPNTLKDNQIPVSQLVVYWTDYVLRYGGTQHLRTAGADMPFYQYFLLDVIAFVSTVIIFLIGSLIYLNRKLKIFFTKFMERKKKRSVKMS